MDYTEATTCKGNVEDDLDVFRVGDLPMYTKVWYEEEWWFVAGHGYSKELRANCSELANGAYWINRLLINSDTPVQLDWDAFPD